MTYNLKFASNDMGINSWVNRREPMKALLQFYAPDILCVQEAFKIQIDEISDALGYDFVGWGRDDGDIEGEFAAIFYNRNLFQKKAEGRFWLSETPDIPSFGWGAGCRRLAVWAELEEIVSGRSFIVVNTHLDDSVLEARVNGSKLLLDRICSLAGDRSVVLTGDFNEHPSGEAVQLLLTRFRDSRAESRIPPIGPAATFNNFDYHNLDVADRIDYVFLKGAIKVEKYASITNFTGDFQFPSDHFPVLAQIYFDLH